MNKWQTYGLKTKKNDVIGSCEKKIYLDLGEWDMK